MTHLRSSYVNRIYSLLNKAIKRLQATPTIDDILDELAEHAGQVSYQSWYSTKGALKAVIAWRLTEFTEPVEDAQRSERAVIEWLRGADTQALNTALKFLDDLRGPMDSCLINRRPKRPTLAQLEAEHSKEPINSRRRKFFDDKDTFIPVDLNVLPNLLHRETRAALIHSRAFPNNRMFNDAMARLAMRVIYAIGVRPSEVFKVSLCQFELDHNNLEEIAFPSQIREDEDIKTGAERVADEISGQIKNIRHRFPLAVHIQNSKAYQAKLRGFPDYRVIILNNAHATEVELAWIDSLAFDLAIIASIRPLMIKRQSAILERARYILKTEAGERGPQTLYHLRHDFTNRMKDVCDRFELMALVGHSGLTPPYTASHYGQKRKRRSGSGSSVVQPLPALVKMFRDASRQPAAAPKASPSPVSL